MSNELEKGRVYSVIPKSLKIGAFILYQDEKIKVLDFNNHSVKIFRFKDSKEYEVSRMGIEIAIL